MAEKKSELVKDLTINLGILLILLSSIAAKDLSATFFLGLILLVLHTFDFKSMDVKKIIAAQILVSASLSISALIQLIMSKTFGAPQVYLILLLLGGLLIMVESFRKHADL